MSQPSPVVSLGRRPPKAATQVPLFTQAGGRCEFDNCNRYLLTHHITHRTGNFAQMAHIVAFRQAGPRGESRLTSEERNDISNLMLLCHQCHKLIDDNPDLFPVETLQKFKKDHEDRIRMLTAAKADKETAALVLTAVIGSSPVAIPLADMQSAVAPFYLGRAGSPPHRLAFCHRSEDRGVLAVERGNHPGPHATVLRFPSADRRREHRGLRFSADSSARGARRLSLQQVPHVPVSAPSGH